MNYSGESRRANDNDCDDLARILGGCQRSDERYVAAVRRMRSVRCYSMVGNSDEVDVMKSVAGEK